MRPLFKDKKLQDEFDHLGYVSIPDFLGAKDLENLKKAFFETLQYSGGQLGEKEADFETGYEITYDFTFIDKNPAYKQLVFDLITKAFMPEVDKWLDNYKPIIANFIRKEKGTGEVPLHENWAFADETQCTTVSIWLPLVDISKEMGVLEMVDGSHKRFGQIRGPMIPWELEGIKKEIIANHLKPLEGKAGTAVVLDDSIVHYSNSNQTDHLRLAIQLILIPSEFPSVHYHMDPGVDDKKVHVLEVDADFYMSFNPWLKPKNVKTIGELPFQFKPMTEDEFSGKLFGPRYDKFEGQKGKETPQLEKKVIIKETQKGFIAKFKSIFGLNI